MYIYHTTTEDVEVSVAPDYLESHSKPDDHQYFWSYTITITNYREMPVQLLSRHWKITDGHGVLREVKGEGVVGQQPVIHPKHSFEYTSGCPLETEQGFMVGTFYMLDHNGLEFSVDVPAFSLDSPLYTRVFN